jgi:hypothetical protein
MVCPAFTWYQMKHPAWHNEISEASIAASQLAIRTDLLLSIPCGDHFLLLPHERYKMVPQFVS